MTVVLASAGTATTSTVNSSSRGRGRIARAARLSRRGDRKSTRLNSSHSQISYAVFCLKKKNKHTALHQRSVLHCNNVRPVAAFFSDVLRDLHWLLDLPRCARVPLIHTRRRLDERAYEQ